jgi:type II secretory pathway pseudopilin PulG
MKTTQNARAGYSLVEVTLALLVVAIGLTATFALFPEGLKATRAAVDDTEIGLFADYVFSTLSATAAALGNTVESGGLNAQKADKYASRVLAESSGYENGDERLLDSSPGLHVFKWVPRNWDLGTGDWDYASKAKFWTTAFTYELEWEKMNKGNNRDTYYAALKVWPGEWTTIADEKKFPPRIFYREIIPYPDM